MHSDSLQQISPHAGFGVERIGPVCYQGSWFLDFLLPTLFVPGSKVPWTEQKVQSAKVLWSTHSLELFFPVTFLPMELSLTGTFTPEEGKLHLPFIP